MRRGPGLLALLLFTLLSCSREPARSPSREARTVAEPVGKAAVVAVREEPDQLVPPLARSPSSAAVWPWILPSLVRIQADSIGEGRFVGDAAIDWEIGEGGWSARFLLDPARLWEDTTAVSADDVVESYRLYRDRRLGGTWPRRLDAIAAVEPIDGGEAVAFRFRRPLARDRILQLAALPLISAEEGRRGRARRPLLGTPERPVMAAGPFRVVEWRKGEFLRLERHPFPPPDRIPRAEQILLRFVPSGRSRALQFERGTVTLATDLPLDAVVRLQDGPRGEGLVQAGPGRIETLLFNLDDPFWGRREARLAVRARLDLGRMLRILSGGGEVPAARGPAGFLGTVPDISDPLPIETLGASPSLTLLYDAADLLHERLAVEIALQLHGIGVDCRMDPSSTAERTARLEKREFQAVLLGWNVSWNRDVGEIYGSDGVFNFAGLRDPILDERIARARSSAGDTLAGVWERVEARAMELAPLIFLGRSARFDGIDPRLRDYRPDPLQTYGNLLLIRRLESEQAPGR